MSLKPNILSPEKRQPFTTSQRGFTLLEVLVAVVILGVGLLGVAGLQVLSVKNTHSAYMRSQATFLAYDIIDSIRANPNAITAYDNIAFGTAPAANQDCDGSTACTTAQLAVHDLNIWKCSLGRWNSHSTCGSSNLNMTGLLPVGEGSVDVNNGTTEVTVTIQWVDDRDGTTTESLAINTQI